MIQAIDGAMNKHLLRIRRISGCYGHGQGIRTIGHSETNPAVYLFPAQMELTPESIELANISLGIHEIKNDSQKSGILSNRMIC